MPAPSTFILLLRWWYSTLTEYLCFSQGAPECDTIWDIASSPHKRNAYWYSGILNIQHIQNKKLARAPSGISHGSPGWELCLLPDILSQSLFDQVVWFGLLGCADTYFLLSWTASHHFSRKCTACCSVCADEIFPLWSNVLLPHFLSNSLLETVLGPIDRLSCFK